MKSGSNLEQILKNGDFAVTGELGPPKNSNPEVVREKARLLKGNVDAVNITDCQTAIVRMSSIGAAVIARKEGLEPVVQMTCRDRNRIAMQSDLLAASALGMKNLLCLTGDHQKFGNHPAAKGVFDMDSIQMLGMVKEMRDESRFQCGEVIKSDPPRFFLGAAVNPFADPFEFRAVRLGKKIAAGADFVQTQIIYNVEKFTRFMEMCRDMGLTDKVYILGGVTPPKSLGMARYMKKFVPGLDVTDEVISRLKDAKDQREEGINICVDIIQQLKEIEGVAGVHVMAIEWEEAVAEICERADLLPRPGISEPDKEEQLDTAKAEELIAKARQEAEQIVVKAKEEAESLKKGIIPEGEFFSSNIDLDAEAVLAKAREEAFEIVDKARKEAEEISRQADKTEAGSVEVVSLEDAEPAFLTREQIMALDSVKLGLDALRLAYGLSEDQFASLLKFVEAEVMLKYNLSARKTVPAPAVSEKKSVHKEIEPALTAGVKEKTVVSPVQQVKEEVSPELDAKSRVKLEAEAKAIAEAKARSAAKAKLDAELKGEDVASEKKEEKVEAKKDKPAAPKPEVKKESSAAEKEKPVVKEEKKEKEPAAKEEKVVAEEEKDKVVESKPAPAKAADSSIEVGSLAREEVPFSERAAKVPPTSYKQEYSGAIREVVMGNGEHSVTVGGEEVLPFHLFEGNMPHRPLIAMEVLDIKPDNWPETLSKYFDDVMDDSVAWAKKCVEEYKAEALTVSLVGTDPNGVNKSSADAAKDAAAIIDAVDVPIVIWGCGNTEKDTETLREITSLIGDKKICLAPLEDANYKAVGATAMAFQHTMVPASPIDVNLAKQLNILLENLGVPLDKLLMDPSVGALGYGIEYTYSVMERIRIAALTQKDEKLQVPVICNLGREVWKAKEVNLPSDDLLGDQENRGIMMEAITASCMLIAGGELLIMRHPKAINLTRSLVEGLMA